MPVMTSCPHCRQALRVADDQVGRHVRCPACKSAFAAGVDRSGVHAAPGRDPNVRAAARARTGPPGLGLMVNGLLTMLVYGGLIAFVALGAAGKFAEVPAPVARWNEFQERQHWPIIARVELEDGFTVGVIVQLVILAVGLAIGLSILKAGFQMRRLRGYRNAVVCSFVSLLPMTTCLWGLPFGLWALMVLFNPAVKQAFES